MSRLGEAAVRLVERGATSVMVEGTSFTFYRGHAFHHQLLARLEALTGDARVQREQEPARCAGSIGRPQTSGRNAYTDEVNDRLLSFLSEAGTTFCS